MKQGHRPPPAAAVGAKQWTCKREPRLSEWHSPGRNWYDKRLKNSTTALDSTPRGLIWVPKFEIFNAVEQRKTDGSVYFYENLELHLECQMDIQAFPFDTQSCGLTFANSLYGQSYYKPHFHKELYYLSLVDELEIAESSLIQIKTIQHGWGGKWGDWPVLELQFQLKRNILPYLSHRYFCSC